jgi:hypothetical protein
MQTNDESPISAFTEQQDVTTRSQTGKKAMDKPLSRYFSNTFFGTSWQQTG